MTVFLTSALGGWASGEGNRRIPAPIIGDNCLAENLRSRWPESARVLFIAANPQNYEKNDSIREVIPIALPAAGLPVISAEVWDDRMAPPEDLNAYQVIILSGGHVPTQNAFFRQIGLKERLKTFRGILIGISAGTMNCAETVYAHPELEGEAIDPHYARFLPGLCLTQRMILPHYQAIKDDVLDGLRVFEDIAYPDSFGRTFYALCDGSYILRENGTETLYGAAFRIRDGILTQICIDGCRQTL